MNVTAKGPRKKPLVIDFHAHSMTQEVFDATYKLSVLGRLRAEAGMTGANFAEIASRLLGN